VFTISPEPTTWYGKKQTSFDARSLKTSRRQSIEAEGIKLPTDPSQSKPVHELPILMQATQTNGFELVKTKKGVIVGLWEQHLKHHVQANPSISIPFKKQATLKVKNR
jgi:hypothetical protein